jgi:hypothetical protein
MPIQQLFFLAVIAMVALATLRLVRVHFGRAPLPEGRGRPLFLFAFVVVPPVALGALTQPQAPAGQLAGLALLPIYVAIVAGLAILMSIVALFVGQVSHRRSGRLVRLALVGREGDPDDVRAEPPVTAKLAESVVVVDKAYAVFPRGPEFPVQIDRAGFRVDWDALDGATSTLESQIADDHRLGLGVASAAMATAKDARSRLNTLQRLAVDSGQAWAAT